MALPRIFSQKKPDVAELKAKNDIHGLIRALRFRDFTVQSEAAKALGSLGTAAIDELLQALTNKDKDIRLGLIGVLTEIKDPRAVPSLLELLNDENAEIRWETTIALGEIGDERAIGSLAKCLYDYDKYVRYGAAFSLAKLEILNRV